MEIDNDFHKPSDYIDYDNIANSETLNNVDARHLQQ